MPTDETARRPATRVALWAALRFVAPRHGWSWAAPVLVMAALMTTLFVVASQSERPAVDAREHRLAGYDAAVYLNDLVSTQDGGSTLAAELDALGQRGLSPDCYAVGASLATGQRAQGVVGLRQNSAACPASEWGFDLVQGRWPSHAGEVAATTGSGYGPGTIDSGLTPEPVRVVGLVESRHDLRARTLFAAPGTWESWGWPEVASRYPGLTGTVTVFLTTDDVLGVRELYADRALTDPAAASIEVVAASSVVTPIPLLERFPYIYRVTGPVVILLSVLVAFAFRRKLLTARIRQLNDLGMSVPSSIGAVSLAFAGVVAAMLALGMTLGWLLSAAAGGPVAQWVSGHQPAPMPQPWDPLARLAGACLIGILVSTLALARSSVARETPVGSEPASADRSAARHVRDVVGIVLACVSVWSVLTIGAFAGIYLAILLTTLAIGCWSSTFALVAARALPESRPSARLAKRRMHRRLGASALMFAVGALTIGPVVATMMLVATQIEGENQAERRAPAEGQARYFASGQPDTDEQVVAVALKIAGADGAVESLYFPTTDEGRGVVATPQGLGAVGLLDDVHAVSQVLRAEVPKQVSDVLEAGGIAFLIPGDRAASVWTVGTGPNQEIPVTGTAFLDADDRWARELSGVMLTQTGQQLGWTLGDPEAVITGLDDAESAAIPSALVDAGYAPSLVRLYSAADPFTVEPLMYGLLGAVGAIGVAILVGASRASLHSLRAQSEGLFSLGAPRSWQGRVFVLETAGAYAHGVLVGTAIAGGITALGIVVLGFVPAVPVIAFTGYLTVAVGAVAVTVTIGTLQLRATRS